MKDNTNNHPLTEHRPAIEGRKRKEESHLRVPEVEMVMWHPGNDIRMAVTAKYVELQVTIEYIDYRNIDTGEIVEQDCAGGTCMIAAESIHFMPLEYETGPDVIKLFEPIACGIEFDLCGRKITVPNAVMTHVDIKHTEAPYSLGLSGVELTGEIGDIVDAEEERKDEKMACEHETTTEWREVTLSNGDIVRVYIEYCTKCGEVVSVSA